MKHLLLIAVVFLTACDPRGEDPVTENNEQAVTQSNLDDAEKLKVENARLRETLEHTSTDAVIAERIKTLREEKAALAERVAAFEAEKKSFEDTRRDALLALDNKANLESREAALETLNLELNKQHSAIILGIATISIVSMLLFYALMTRFLARKIATTVIASLAVTKGSPEIAL